MEVNPELIYILTNDKHTIGVFVKPIKWNGDLQGIRSEHKRRCQLTELEFLACHCLSLINRTEQNTLFLYIMLYHKEFYS